MSSKNLKKGMREKTLKEYSEIEKSILDLWSYYLPNLGLKRSKLISFSDGPLWKINRCLAYLRKKRYIVFHKNYYFYTDKAIKEFDLKVE